jgi:hypothetical protein
MECLTVSGTFPTHSSDITTSSSNNSSSRLSNMEQQQHHATSNVILSQRRYTINSTFSKAERSTWPLSITSSSGIAAPTQPLHRALHSVSTGLLQQQQHCGPLQLLQHSGLPLLLQHHQQHHQQHEQLVPQGAHQLQQKRGVKQLRPFAEAPKPPPRFRRPDKDGRMNRMVVRIPPQVQVAVQDGHLVVTGGSLGPCTWLLPHLLDCCQEYVELCHLYSL